MPRRLVLIATGTAGLLACAGIWLAASSVSRSHRLTAVIPGAVYRGAQLDAAALEEVASRFAIRSVINLRGGRGGERWYREEVDACRALGLGHADVRIKLDDAPPRQEVRRFIAYLDEMPRPLLLHCKTGSDRAGWGAAVARCLAGEPLEASLGELSLGAGHLCVPSRCPLHRFFAAYARWLAETHRQHDGATFRFWALEAYCPEPYDAALALLRPSPPLRAAPGATITAVVEARNHSHEVWRLSPATSHGVRLGARALGPLAGPLLDPLGVFRTPGSAFLDLGRAGLEEGEVRPGEARVFELAFSAPREPGSYSLQLDMVDEQVHWFSDLGRDGLVLSLEVARNADVPRAHPGP